MNVISAMPSLALLTITGLIATACGDPATAPVPGAAAFVVTDPVSRAASIAASRSGGPAPSASVAAVDGLAFVSLVPGSEPGGTRVTIVNRRTQESTAAPMANGGFDPIGIDALVGDTLEIAIAFVDRDAKLAKSIVPATRPPRVVRTSPPKGRTDVAINATMSVVFSEPIDLATLDTTTIWLRQGDISIGGELRPLPGSTEVQFIPASPLAAGTEYTIAVGAGIADLGGDRLQEPAEFDFRTAATPPSPASDLLFTRQPVGAEIWTSRLVEVTVLNGLGEVARDYDGYISLTLGNNPTGATLLGTIQVKPVNGVAQFPEMMVSKPGVGYTMRAHSGALPPAFSAPFTDTDFASRWIEKAPPPPNVVDAVGVALNGQLYLVGGAEGPAIPQRTGLPVSRVAAYDPATNGWSLKASLPTSDAWDAAAVVNGILYAIGGSGNAVAAYNPATDTWTTRAAAPAPRRSGASAAAVGGTLYLVGGETSSGAVGTVEAYDPATDSWTARASMPTPRSGARIAVANGRLYVVGGIANGAPVEVLEVFDPITNSWTSRPRMWIPRYLAGVAELDGTVYAIGGINSGPLRVGTVERYDLATDLWRLGPSVPENGSVASVVNGVLYAVTNSRTFAFAP